VPVGAEELGGEDRISDLFGDWGLGVREGRIILDSVLTVRGWQGKGSMQTRSPGESAGETRVGFSGGEALSTTAMAMPRPAHWISPVRTGRRGQGAPKREMMSVPPVMEARLMREGKAE
jgi:hypothetical protein